MNDPLYIPAYDSNGNEIWINPDAPKSYIDEMLDNTPENKFVVVNAKRTYWWVLILAVLFYFLYKYNRGKS
jgi:hypothetical protein